MEYCLQQLWGSHPSVFDKVGGIVAAAEGLKTFLRMYDEGEISQARAAIVSPVTKVIIAPH